MSNFVFNLPGLRELMKSAGMQSSLTEAGRSVAAIANGSCSGYATDTHEAPLTSVCTVYPSTKEAGHDNYFNNTLLRAVSSAGLEMTIHAKR